MTDLPPEMQMRRDVEDDAIRLGRERADLDDRLARNTQAVIDLFEPARAAGIPIDGYARMIGVSRQTLYRWLNVAEKLQEAR